MSTQIDYSRIVKAKDEFKSKALLVEKFVEEKIYLLNLLNNKFENFKQFIGASELLIGNMYSTHDVGYSNDAYTDKASMKCQVKLRLSKTYKNIKLIENKIKEKFELIVGIRAVFVYYRPTTNYFEFEIFI